MAGPRASLLFRKLPCPLPPSFQWPRISAAASSGPSVPSRLTRNTVPLRNEAAPASVGWLLVPALALAAALCGCALDPAQPRLDPHHTLTTLYQLPLRISLSTLSLGASAAACRVSVAWYVMVMGERVHVLHPQQVA